MTDIIPLQYCNKCQEYHPLTADFFYADNRRTSGFRTPCKKWINASAQSPERKAQRKQYLQVYNEGHKEEINSAQKLYRETHQEAIREYGRKYRETYREKIRLRRKLFRQAHKGYRKDYHQQWINAHSDRRSMYQRHYYARHGAVIREKQRVQYHTHKTEAAYISRMQSKRQRLRGRYKQYKAYYRQQYRERINSHTRNRRARKRNANGSHTMADIQVQYQRQHGKCYYCGIKLGTGKRAYHVDHIIPITRGGTNDPSNLVITCHFCNESKGAKLPHEWPAGGRLL